MKNVLGMAVLAFGLSIGLVHAEDIELGKTLYVANCQKCHGAKAQGGVGAKLAGDATKWDFDVFKNAVLNGRDDENRQLKKPMPLFGTVGFQDPAGKIPEDADLKNIFAYIKTFVKH